MRINHPKFRSFSAESVLSIVTLEIVHSIHPFLVEYNQTFVGGPAKLDDFALIPLVAWNNSVRGVRDSCLGRTESIKRLSPAGEYNCIWDLDKTGAVPRAIATILLVSLINAAASQGVNRQAELDWIGILRKNTPYLTDRRTCNLPRRNHRALAVYLRYYRPADACRRPFHLASRPMML